MVICHILLVNYSLFCDIVTYVVPHARGFCGDGLKRAEHREYNQGNYQPIFDGGRALL